MEKSNPFKFGEAVGGEYFTDREEEIEKLLLDLSSCQNVILYSARRYGKTSLILKVLSKLRGKGYICIYADLFPASSKRKFAQILATAISKGVSSKLEDVGKTLREILPVITPKIILKSEGLDMEVELSSRETDIDKTLEELYDAPAKIASRRKKKVIVVFDEFQEIDNINGEEIEKNMRSKIQHHSNVGYVFMGSKRHLIDDIFNNRNRAFYGIGKFFSLGKIPKEEFVSFIKKRFSATGLKINKDLSNKILSLTECHPYYTQMLCHEAWNESHKKRVDEKSLERAINSVINSQSYAFTSIWDGVSPKQRNLLIALVNGESSLHSQDVVVRYDLGSPATVSKSLKTLEEKEIIVRENGSFNFIDPFFREWIRLRIG